MLSSFYLPDKLCTLGFLKLAAKQKERKGWKIYRVGRDTLAPEYRERELRLQDADLE